MSGLDGIGKSCLWGAPGMKQPDKFNKKGRDLLEQVGTIGLTYRKVPKKNTDILKEIGTIGLTQTPMKNSKRWNPLGTGGLADSPIIQFNNKHELTSEEKRWMIMM